jgi:hypothetical protein
MKWRGVGMKGPFVPEMWWPWLVLLGSGLLPPHFDLPIEGDGERPSSQSIGSEMWKERVSEDFAIPLNATSSTRKS